MHLQLEHSRKFVTGTTQATGTEELTHNIENGFLMVSV